MNRKVYESIILNRNVGALMNNYKINLIYNDEGLNLNDLIIQVLINDLNTICNKTNYNVSSNCTYLFLKKEKNFEIFREYK